MASQAQYIYADFRRSAFYGLFILITHKMETQEARPQYQFISFGSSSSNSVPEGSDINCPIKFRNINKLKQCGIYVALQVN